jgi:hypothetical protein
MGLSEILSSDQQKILSSRYSTAAPIMNQAMVSNGTLFSRLPVVIGFL